MRIVNESTVLHLGGEDLNQQLYCRSKNSTVVINSFAVQQVQ